MEFINLREEALNALKVGKRSSSVVRVVRRETTAYLYKHAIIIDGTLINGLNGDIDELVEYVNNYLHISKIILPNCSTSVVFMRVLKSTGFFKKINRKIRIIIRCNNLKKFMNEFKTDIEENNIRLYNFTKPLMYALKHRNFIIFCEFANEQVTDIQIYTAVVNYTIV